MGIGGLGMWEILLIFVVVLLLFGAKRLPEVGAALGKGIREFKSSVREIEGEFKAPEDRRSIAPTNQLSQSAPPPRSSTPAAQGAPLKGEPVAEESGESRSDPV